MESLKIENVIAKLREKQISLLTFSDFCQIFPHTSKPGLYAALKRLQKTNTIKRIERGKYEFLLSTTKHHEYQLANFIYQPSYVSLETALSFYGLIDQFSYQITSVTTKKALSKSYEQKDFIFSHIEPNLLIDYHRQDNYLIASKKKAIFDYFYLAFKGFRSRSNLQLIKLNHKEKNEFTAYISKNYTKPKLLNFTKSNL